MIAYRFSSLFCNYQFHYLSAALKKILIIRFSSIGDIVLTSPVIRCLHEQLPNTQIHYLTKPAFAELLNCDKRIHTVWQWSKNPADLIGELKAQGFDFIVDLHHNLRSLRVKRALGKPSASFQKLNVQKFLMVHFKINLLPKVHIVERYLETIKKLKVENDGKGLEFFLSDKDSMIPHDFEQLIKKPFIVIAIGAQHATKRMPFEKIQQLISNLSFPILLVGGKDDQRTGEILQKAFPDRVTNTAGLLSIGQSAYIVKRSSLLITHDTGMMHIGAAFQKPIISIWGNTIPAFGMTPYMPGLDYLHHEMEVNNLSCRPCSKIGHQTCPKKHFNCMQLQDIDEISRLALSIMNGQSSPA